MTLLFMNFLYPNKTISFPLSIFAPFIRYRVVEGGSKYVVKRNPK